ncbi:MAG: oligosaccharide flippase family protein [Deltaproteobacteria bacterium]|nr:oligosaccharide flippase family protein [Deltaproteobacteria bacterium]
MLKFLKQLASESLVYGLAGIASRFLSIFLVPIYTRIFSPEDYGVMSLVTTTMSLVGIFVILALDSAAGRWYWDTKDENDRKTTLSSWFWCQLVVASSFCAITLIFSSELSHWIVKDGRAAIYFQISAFALPIGLIGFVTSTWLRMQRRPWATTFYALGVNIFNIVMTLILVVFLRWGLLGIFYAQLFSAIVGGGIAIFLMRDWIHPRYLRFSRLSDMIKYAMPLIPASLAFWIVNSCDRYFIQNYSSTAEVGLYQVGSSIAWGIALFTGAFQQAWGPFSLSIHKRDDAKEVYAHVLLAYLWVTCVGVSLLAMFGSEVIMIFATQRYLGANSVIGLLSLSYVMIGLGFIASVGPTIMKTTAPTGFGVTMAAILNILFNFLLVPLWGKTGSAVATLVSQAMMPIYLFYRSQQMYPIPYRFRPATIIFITAIIYIIVGALWQVHHLDPTVIVTKLLLVSLFVPVAFMARIITPDQARKLLSSIPGMRKEPV